MKINTEPGYNIIDLEPGDLILLRFSSDGYNALLNQEPDQSLTIGTIIFGEKMGVSIASSSQSSLYQSQSFDNGETVNVAHGELFIIRDDNNPDELIFKDKNIKLVRIIDK